MPVDAEPRPDGNIKLEYEREGIFAIYVGKPDQDTLFESKTGAERYVSHFATCPNADQFRKKTHNP
jgi:hypothetical protein